MSRRPTYSASARLVRLVLALLVHRDQGMTLTSLPDRLGCSRRTVDRYLAVLRSRGVDPTAAGASLLEYGFLTHGRWEPADECDPVGRRGRRVRIAEESIERIVATWAPEPGARRHAA